MIVADRGNPMTKKSCVLILALFMIFLTVSIGFGMLLSASALLLEEMSFHLYTRPLDTFVLLIVALLENLGYRQLNTLWRVMAIFRHILMIARGEKRWT